MEVPQLCNKIWNASRYVLSHTDSHNLNEGDAALSLADRWIQSRLETTLIAVEEAYDNYRFDLASQASTTLCGMSSVTGTWSCPSQCCGTRPLPHPNNWEHAVH